MRVDVVDVHGIQARVGQRDLHRPRAAAAVRARRRDVVRVTAGAVAAQGAEDRRAARAGRVARLEHEHARALAHDEAVTAVVERARRAGRRDRAHRPNAARESGVSGASAAPVTIASASPCWIIRRAVPIAWLPAAQADTTLNTGPRSPCCSDSAADPALLIMSGIASGETESPPCRAACRGCPRACRSRRCRCRARSRSARGRRAARRSSRPRRAPRSPAAIASCVERSARRACLADMWSVGSKSAHGASPSRMPQAPSVQRSCSVRAPTPSGVTAPTPVMTTSRKVTPGRARRRGRRRRRRS